MIHSIRGCNEDERIVKLATTALEVQPAQYDYDLTQPLTNHS